MLPPVGYAQPTLQLHQLAYNAVAFAGNVAGSPYQAQAMTGVFDQPSVASGDVQRDLDTGEFAGMDVSPGRDMTFQLVVQTDGVSFDHARQALGGAFTVAGSIEEPLFLQLASGLYACMARPRKYALPYDAGFEQAGRGIASIAMHATDPRWYLQPTAATTIAPNNTATITNSGYVEMRPVFVIAGPCIDPQLVNQTLYGSPGVQVNVTLNAGDTLTIDMQARSAVLLTAGSTIGVSVANEITDASTWFNLPPVYGAQGIASGCLIGFNAASPGAGCQCVAQYAPAYLAV
jgi:hypothetical protein